MNTEDTHGASLRGDDADARKQAASLMGQARTDRKIEAARENVAKATEARRGKPMSEEHKNKIAAARLAGEAARRQARPSLPVAEKRGPGRPKKQEETETP